ncbi:MAG: transglycosylase SLT domain-containing protein [Polyangiaceae bacterium]
MTLARWSAAALAGFVSLSPGCAGGPPVPRGASSELVVASASASASSSASPVEAGPADPIRVEPLLADSRLRVVSDLLAKEDAAGAASAMETAIQQHQTSLTKEERGRWFFQLGRLYRAAHNDASAAKAFGDSAAVGWVLSAHASLASAQCLARLGRWDDVLIRTNEVPDGLPITPQAKLLTADALVAKGSNDRVITLLRDYLASSSKPARWAEISVRLSRALLDSSSDAAAAEEAFKLARRVLVETVSSPILDKAATIEAEALQRIPLPRRDELAPRTKADELARLNALVEAGRSKDADPAIEGLEKSLSKEEQRSELGCKVALLSAQTKSKLKQRDRAFELYGDAIDRCTGETKITALYQGAKAASAAKRLTEARARYERVEKEAPKHRLADDARLKGAEAALLMNDEPRFVAMLETIAEDYPEGDMVADGLFRLAWLRIDRGDWAGAIAPLEKANKARPLERAYYAAGRTQYFHARALMKTGDRARGLEELHKVVRDFPLTYTMALAYARLAEVSPADAKNTLEEAVAKAPDSAFVIADRPAFHTPGFPRVIELLRQGESDLARTEINALGLMGTDAPADALWAAAVLFSRAGAHAQAHVLPRGRVTDWLAHYPAGSWRAAWEVAYPRPFFDLVSAESKKHGIPLSLAYGIMREESAFDPVVASPAKAYGLMQLIVPTAKTMAVGTGLHASEDTLKTPAVNVALGTKFLSVLRGQFAGCPLLAIPSYNAGPNATKRWLNAHPQEDFDVFIERIPYEETRNYIKRVMGSMAAYAFLYEPNALDEVLRAPTKLMCAAGTPAGPPAEDE